MKTDYWLLALHVVGVIVWVGGLTAVMALLTAHARVDEGSRGTLTMVEKRIAIVMDLGATLAIGLGLYLALRHTPNEFKHGPWLHIKLTAVVAGVLSTHGWVRVRIKKNARGEVKPVPVALWILLAAGAGTAAILGANTLLLRG